MLAVYNIPFLYVLLTICLCQHIEYDSYEMFASGTTVNGLDYDEISGITYNSYDNLYYAIPDNTVTNKGFYGFSFTENIEGNLEFTFEDNYQMDAANGYTLTSMDTESIAFVENPYDMNASYYFIAQEGYSTSNGNELYLYSIYGEYITSLTKQLPVKYAINNTDSNRGFEAIAIDIDQTYFVYTTESVLLSDKSFCNECVRLSVNEFIVNDDDTVIINELYELRYDLDPDPDGGFTGFVDIVIFKNREDNDKLYALVLEREYVTLIENKIYLIDLTLGDVSNDVSNCYSLSETECMNIAPLNKTLLITFSDDINPNDVPTPALNFEVLAIYYDDNNQFYDDDGSFKLIAMNDNAALTFSTAILYLTYYPPQQSTTDVPDTTVIDTTEDVFMTYAISTEEPTISDNDSGTQTIYHFSVYCAHVVLYLIWNMI